MHEDEHSRYNVKLLNDYIERDMEEREVRESLVQEYHEWDTKETGSHGDQEEGQDAPRP